MQAVYLVLNYCLLVRTFFGPCLRADLLAVVPALTFGLAMPAVVGAVGWSARGLAWPLALALSVASGAAVYGGLVLAFRRRVVEDLAIAATGERGGVTGARADRPVVLLTAEGDVLGLTEALHRLASDPDLCARFAAGGRADVEERFDVHVLGRRSGETYLELSRDR